MSLSSASPTWQHVLLNLALLALAAVATPYCTIAIVLSWLIAPYQSATEAQRLRRKCRTQPRRILVTGVGMSKGLAIARAFYRGGYQVIAADFEPYRIPVCGRFSSAIEKFYRLPQDAPEGLEQSSYVQAILSIIKREHIDLWVSCSGVASALEDATTAEAVETFTQCKAIQFGIDMTGTLHEKFSFNENTRNLGLNVPETHLITSINDAMTILHPDKTSKIIKFIMKPVGVDDTVRADMTLLPRPSASQTKSHISRLKPSPSRPFVLQQFIQGPEFCTHSIVIRGQVMLFTACPSADMLMHYQSLPLDSPLFQVMFDYTKAYAAKMEKEMTGHFSMDFLVDGPNKGCMKEDLAKRIFPIECNPRAHTAVVLFGNDAEKVVDCYLQVFDKDDNDINTVFPSSQTRYYWLGHDFVTRVLLPFFNLITLRTTLRATCANFLEFLEHVLYWKDGTFEVWDPWPFWWLYCVYWPGKFLVSILTGAWWSRCNVSTTKLFRC
jgi:hypothetical protein